jgi:hypothetical protein
MATINEILGAVVSDMPPSRDIEGVAVLVRKIPVLDVHVFTSANAEGDDRMTSSNKLPPPERWAICRMNEIEVAEMIERHIDYYAVDKDGNRHSVHLHETFVQHYIKRNDGALPTTKAYATMPIVLGSGELLAPTGLDRLRGIQFLIPDAVRAIIPKKEDCGPEQVKAAMKFLCGEWLVDVTTSAVGKATIIALALTLIERIMLTNRPCFSITAGRRGTGKTTLIMMLIRAVTGVTATAAAWSPNEEERRKAIMSYLVRGEEAGEILQVAASLASAQPEI